MQSSQTLTAQDCWMIFLTLLITVMAPFASDSYTPSMPAITQAFGVTADQMQLTMTFYLFGVSFSQLIYGPASDRFGRRSIVLLGLLIAVIGSFFCSAATSLDFLLLARLVQGCGAGVSNALFRAVMRDSFSGPKMSQVASYAGIFYMGIFSSAPILGGYIQTYLGWRANFIFTGLLGAAIVTILWFYLHETHTKFDETATRFTNIIRNYFSMLCTPTFIGYTLISSLAFSGMVAYYTAAPFLMQNVVGLTSVQFGWMSLGLGGGIAIGQYINAKLVTKYGVKLMLLIGLSTMSIGGLSMLAFGLLGVINTYVIVIPVIIYGVAAGLVFTNAMANALHHFANLAGTAGALYGSLQILGSSLISILVSVLPETSQVPLAMVFSGLGIAAILIYIGLQLIGNKK